MALDEEGFTSGEVLIKEDGVVALGGRSQESRDRGHSKPPANRRLTSQPQKSMPSS